MDDSTLQLYLPKGTTARLLYDTIFEFTEPKRSSITGALAHATDWFDAKYPAKFKIAPRLLASGTDPIKNLEIGVTALLWIRKFITRTPTTPVKTLYRGMRSGKFKHLSEGDTITMLPGDRNLASFSEKAQEALSFAIEKPKAGTYGCLFQITDLQDSDVLWAYDDTEKFAEWRVPITSEEFQELQQRSNSAFDYKLLCNVLAFQGTMEAFEPEAEWLLLVPDNGIKLQVVQNTGEGAPRVGLTDRKINEYLGQFTYARHLYDGLLKLPTSKFSTMLDAMSCATGWFKGEYPKEFQTNPRVSLLASTLDPAAVDRGFSFLLWLRKNITRTASISVHAPDLYYGVASKKFDGLVEDTSVILRPRATNVVYLTADYDTARDLAYYSGTGTGVIFQPATSIARTAFIWTASDVERMLSDFEFQRLPADLLRDPSIGAKALVAVCLFQQELAKIQGQESYLVRIPDTGLKLTAIRVVSR